MARWRWLVAIAASTQYFFVYGFLYNYSILFVSLQEEFGTGAAFTGKETSHMRKHRCSRFREEKNEKLYDYFFYTVCCPLVTCSASNSLRRGVYWNVDVFARVHHP